MLDDYRILKISSGVIIFISCSTFLKSFLFLVIIALAFELFAEKNWTVSSNMSLKHNLNQKDPLYTSVAGQARHRPCRYLLQLLQSIPHGVVVPFFSATIFIGINLGIGIELTR